MNFRTLRADEIECRLAAVKKTGVSLLLYKDARVDQNILDETVGAMNWQRSHQSIDGRLYCTVSIRDVGVNECWVSKQDVGTESNAEKEKGQASDSFKRACFNWGIGRELYTAPFIWITQPKVKINEINGKSVCYDKFAVSEIEYDKNQRITHLVITNKTSNIKAYEFGEESKSESNTPQDTLYVEQNHISTILKETERTGVDLQKQILALCNITDIKQMTMQQFKSIMDKFKVTPDKKTE